MRYLRRACRGSYIKDGSRSTTVAVQVKAVNHPSVLVSNKGVLNGRGKGCAK